MYEALKVIRWGHSKLDCNRRAHKHRAATEGLSIFGGLHYAAAASFRQADITAEVNCDR